MSDSRVEQVLKAVQSGELEVSEAMNCLAEWPFEDLEFAKLDHHRELRKGFPEVVFGEGKTLDQLRQLLNVLAQRHSRILATRVSAESGPILESELEKGHYHPLSRVLTVGSAPEEGLGSVVVACAGTSDLPVAEEALLTLQQMGSHAELIADVGVAGLHRILKQLPRLRKARVIVVAAGMDGALPSVVGGLVSCPVIAVPTSVGYGACFEGVAPLLTMLNSCAPGVTVVNIDNGFGAGYAAHRINQGSIR